MGFYDWLLSLSIMLSKFSIAVACVSASFFFIAKYSVVCIDHIWFIHLSTDGHFHSGYCDNAAVNIHIVCMWAYVFISPRNGIAGSCGNSVKVTL